MKLTQFKLSLLCIATILAGCQSADQTVADTNTKAEYQIKSANVREDFIKGVDMSMLPELEKLGAAYYESGVQKDVIEILADNGVNYLRARLWVDPETGNGTPFGGGNSTLERSIELGLRAHEHGMKFLLDLHYSDFWADPKKQVKPKAWANLSFSELEQNVYDYTSRVMQEHINAGVVPDMVQVGNELNGGMLWPDGKSWGGDGHEFDRLSKLLKAGIKAVHDNEQNGQHTPIMLHLAEAGNNGLFRWWFDEITKHNVEYDVIGMSYYPFWHGAINMVKANIEDVVARYKKPVIIAETSFPFTEENGDGLANGYSSTDPVEGYPISVTGQAQYLSDFMSLINSISDDKGLGIFYWEPAWLPINGATWATKDGMKYIGEDWQTGNSWDNQALFDFSGNALPSLKVFNK